jgi:GH25 family lysozyme M1 (1,4-beta-N-acetylmuramidase)
MGLPKAQAFIDAVEVELGRKNQCVIYSGNLIKETLPPTNKDAFWPAHRLWLAQYGTKPVWPSQWETFWLWQYTDGDFGPQPHTVQGIKGGIDCNSFSGTPEQLKASWSGANLGQPEPPVVVPEIVIIAPEGVKVTVKQS